MLPSGVVPAESWPDVLRLVIPYVYHSRRRHVASVVINIQARSNVNLPEITQAVRHQRPLFGAYQSRQQKSREHPDDPDDYKEFNQSEGGGLALSGS
jgi:hypothetical protein